LGDSWFIVRLLIAFPDFGRHQMHVHDQIKKCVAFIGCKPIEEFWGTVLFFGDDTTGRCMITAKHVILPFQKRLADDVWLRVNTKAGECEWVRTDRSNWIFPEDPSLDIAVHFGCLNDEADHMILDRQLALTPTIAKTLDVGIGDEVFVTGLFADYTGKHRNVPILRVGNLAAYPTERVQSQIEERQPVEMDAYLIDTRSIGGLSGSPVFYHSHGSHTGILRPAAPEMLSPLTDQSFYLMGIVHGHYGTRKENSGIAIVVPVERILNFIDARAIKSGEKCRVGVTSSDEHDNLARSSAGR